jgi:2-oxoglutarate ferredoxin oxidoreductase subunit alpha
MMEGVVLPPERPLTKLSGGGLPHRDWVVGHMAESHRESRHITSINLVPEELEAKTKKRFVRYEEIKARETRFEQTGADDADLTLVAYGTAARVALGARKLAEKEGIKLGLFRPITLWPFPYAPLAKIAGAGKPILTVEMSLGQLVEDVKLAALDIPAQAPRPAIHLLGHSGGVIPTEEEVFAEAKRIIQAQGKPRKEGSPQGREA